ncbi:rootletin [Ischnura elegans]|uniref:rootletin n=1 Tax=Ischnura elegans TaxID=197161 RepID=UPI001ED8A0BC|nr:rootletin [Ischnura elegans]
MWSTTIVSQNRPIDRSKASLKTPIRRNPTSASESSAMDDEVTAETIRLRRQNQELRRTLEDETAIYKRRLDSYRQAQQQQAALVGRLQAKVLQYKQRCLELEGRPGESIPSTVTHGVSSTADTVPGTSSPEPMRHYRDYGDEGIHDLETALAKLEEERKKCDEVLRLNARLHERLEESHRSGEALAADLQRLTNDWDRLRDETSRREEEWREEERGFNEYYSAEHGRLLGLWRDVVSVRRLFTELNAATERDLARLRSDLTSTSREIGTACSCLLSTIGPMDVDKKQRQDWEKMQQELMSQISELKSKQEATQMEVQLKEDRIQQLLREMQGLEERCGDAEAGINQVSRLREEVELLQGALRDIARAVIQDAESRDEGYMGGGAMTAGASQSTAMHPPSSQHMHLTPTGPIPPRSPKRGALRTPTSPAFAESTISAVQAALHKHQLQIHELQVKLQSSKEQLQVVKKQEETSEQAQQALEHKLSELTQELDKLHSECNSLNQDKDVLQKALDLCRSEKANLEKNRQDINQMVETLNNDYEKIQKSNSKLQKLCDNLEDEKLFLQGELDRLNKDAEIREISLRTEEERCSRLREDLLTVREELNGALLAKDVLEQQRSEADSLMSQIEKSRGELELELERVLLERSDAQEALVKLESVCSSLEQDKRKLQEDLKKVEEERASLQNVNSDQQGDLGSLRKELLQAEQTRLDLESDKVSLLERVKFLELEKEKVELELGQVSRERSELSGQVVTLSRARETLLEEAARARQRLDQAAETNARLNRDVEALMRTQEERGVALAAADKECQRLTEQLAALRAEKEGVEAALYEAQAGLEAAEERRETMEVERQALMVERESLRGKVSRLSADLEAAEQHTRDTNAANARQIAMKDAEFQSTITNLKRQAEETANKLNEEKEQMRVAMERRLQTTVAQMEGDKDGEIERLTARLESSQHHIETLAQQHEEALLRAENDKQQALLIAQHDQQAVQERLDEARRELDEARSLLERFRRESANKSEQDRSTINQLREEAARLKSKIEEAKMASEEDKTRSDNKLEELRKERDVVQSECEELKVQLHLAEDRHDAVQTQLHDTTRKLKEVENLIESLRKELTDTRRQLNDSNYEKEKYGVSNKELREHVKRIEGEKREGGRALEEAFQKISALEDAKTTLEMERSRIQAQVRELERAQLQSGQKIASLTEELEKAQNSQTHLLGEQRELRARLACESEEKDRSHQELHRLKKQVAEMDANLEATRGELARIRMRGEAGEERWRAKEQELVGRLEEGRVRERKLEDRRHNLEVCLADASQQIQELKAKLGAAEGHLRALDAQLQQMENAKKETEQKLSSVGASLRRFAGIQPDGSVSLPFRLVSPSRSKWGQVRIQDAVDGRGGGETPAGLVDLDPELVRKGIRSLMQQVAQMERERDDYKTQVGNVKRQLQEVQETQNKGDTKMAQMQHSLRTLQDEKGSLEALLGQKQTALQSQAEALQQKSEEARQMKEKVTALELTVRNSCDEKSQCEDRLEKLRQALARLESEKQAMHDELGRSEGRATKLELQRLALDGDLQRMQMVLQEKDAHIQKIQEKSEMQGRTVASLEERCGSLKATVEQLRLSLERAAAAESELRSEVQRLNRALLDSSVSSQSGTDKMKQLQKSLSNSENERRVLAERLDSLQRTLADVRRDSQNLLDQNQRLQTQLANAEVQRSGLEARLRLSASSWTGDGGPPAGDGAGANNAEELASLRRERAELRSKVDSLMEKLRQMEAAERRRERSKSYERPEKTIMIGSSGLTSEAEVVAALERENQDLQFKVRKLEVQLAEREAEVSKLLEKLRSMDSYGGGSSSEVNAEMEHLRAAQLQAERLLEAREQSHRQQVLRLENQVQLLREQLNQEVKRRQLYVLRSSRAGREMQQLRQVLGDSLRTVAQDPALDAILLHQEARKLDSTRTASAAPSPLPVLSLPYHSDDAQGRSITPTPK